MIRRYAKFLARYSWLILLVTLAVCSALTLAVLFGADLPKFEDPKEGFVTKGTKLSNAAAALRALRYHSSDVFYQEISREQERRKHGSIAGRQPFKRSFQQFRVGQFMQKSSEHGTPGEKTSCRAQWSQASVPEFASIVIQLPRGVDTLSTKSLDWQCHFESRLFGALEKNTRGNLTASWCDLDEKCCRSLLTLPRLLSWEAGTRICAKVDRIKISYFKERLIDCRDGNCDLQNEVNSNIKLALDYLLDQTYVRSLNESSLDSSDDDVTNDDHVTHDSSPNDGVSGGGHMINLVMPVSIRSLAVEYFDGNLLDVFRDVVSETNEESDLDVTLVALNFDLAQRLFGDELLADTVHGVIAVLLVLLLAWFYTGSIIFTFFAVSGILLSLSVAYFVYRFLLQIKIFPFMNLLVIVLSVGVGADDTFVLRHFWLSARTSKNPGTLSRIIYDTLSHAVLSMFVTSLTTAVAFLSNCLSNVVAIKCFGIFASLTIMVNYFLVITWLSASLVFIEKIGGANFLYNLTPSVYLSKYHPKNVFLYLLDHYLCLYDWTMDWGRVIFEKILPCLVIKLRYFWLISLSALSISSVAYIVHEKEHWMPDRAMRFFRGRNELEEWDSGSVFRRFSGYPAAKGLLPPPITHIVWGVKTVNVPYPFDPDYDLRSITPDPGFGMTNSMTIHWFKDFCADLKRQPFVRKNPTYFSCFVEDYLDYMHRSCRLDRYRKRNRLKSFYARNTLCCNETTFPYSKETNLDCLPVAAQIHHKLDATKQGGNMLPHGIYFRRNGEKNETVTPDKNSVTPRKDSPGAFVVAFPTAYNFTFDYGATLRFWNEVDAWLTRRMAETTVHLRNAFWVMVDFPGRQGKDLWIFDMQRSLADGTMHAVTLALVCAFLVLLFSTHNLLTSFLASFSIFSIIVVTIALLLLLQWRLNVVESTIIILTVGLSFDFTLHYAVAYGHRHMDGSDRESRVIFAIGCVGSPIFMSFLTTFVAGCAMAPARTLAYHQIGIFMMSITAVSWLYSTFFFNTLLYILGPRGNCCNLIGLFGRCPCCDADNSTNENPPRSAFQVVALNPNTTSAVAIQRLPLTEPVHNGVSSSTSDFGSLARIRPSTVRTPTASNSTNHSNNNRPENPPNGSLNVPSDPIYRPNAASTPPLKRASKRSTNSAGNTSRFDLGRLPEWMPLSRHRSLVIGRVPKDNGASSTRSFRQPWTQSIKSSLRRVTKPLSQRFSGEGQTKSTLAEKELSTPLSAKTIFADPESNTLAYIDVDDLFGDVPPVSE